tara:strand:+ start:808 stop:1494 length:687 start_codon:yes stop_codon:yes gene_type:complete
MAQHDYNIANQTAANARTDINNVLSAIATNNSGSSAPSTTFANMWWYDTSNNILKIRAEGNDAWISVAYLDQTGDNFRILDDTQVVNTSGTQTGLLGDQATATWETGTGTVESLVSPAKVAASATEVVADYALGVGQTWQNLTTSRSFNVIYQNTTGRPIAVNVTGGPAGNSTMIFQVSSNSNMSGFVQLGGQFDNDGQTSFNAIIPDNQYYRVAVGSAGLYAWAELR